VYNRKPFSFSSEAFAGMRITHHHQKEAEPEGHHEGIKHEVLLSRLFPCAMAARSGKSRWRWIKNDKRLVAPGPNLQRSRICFRDDCYVNVI
jgi:hypothetical protein